MPSQFFTKDPPEKIGEDETSLERSLFQGQIVSKLHKYLLKHRGKDLLKGNRPDHQKFFFRVGGEKGRRGRREEKMKELKKRIGRNLNQNRSFFEEANKNVLPKALNNIENHFISHSHYPSFS
jgi:hypothetical protein